MKSIIESILFSAGEPISIKKLAETLNKKQSLVEELVRELAEDYQNKKRGLRIIQKEKEIQLVSNPENSKYVEKMVKDEVQEDLTPAALETLAIIAYRGPISRAEIEEIRGVNSSYILRNLLIRGLIDRKEHPKDNRAYIYQISFNFLRKLGLQSIEELPDYNKFQA